MAIEMARGLLQCTANIVGPGKCGIQVIRRVVTASQTGVCVTGSPSAPSLSSLSANPSVINSGQAGVGTVTLSGPAGTGGVVVSVSTSDAAVQIPPSVEIPEGSASATFQIVGNVVPAVTSAIITISYSGVWATTNLSVYPGTTVTLASLSVSPGLLISGQSATGTITLTGVAPGGGAPVSLSSNSGAVIFPATVTVPQGSRSALFTLNGATVSKSTEVQLTASYAGANSVVTLTIDPSSVNLTWISSSSPDVAGYNVYRGTISGGPYTQLNSATVPGVSYLDSSVQRGLTYFYVTTSVNTSSEQSVYSNEAQVSIH